MLKSKELPLIVFTLLTQAAVGLFATMVIVREFLGSRVPEALQVTFTQGSLVISLLFLATGTGIATRHLGQQSKAHRAIRNLSSSNLSREMLLGGLFGGIIAVLALLAFLQVGADIVQPIVSFVGLLIGLVLVFTIAKVYLIRTVPAWNSPATPFSFFLTTLLLGLISSVFLWIVASIHTDNQQHDFVATFTQVASILVTILLSAQLTTFLSNLVGLSRRGRAALTSVHTIFVTHRLLFALRIVLAMLSLAPLLVLVGNGVTYSRTAMLLFFAGIALGFVWAGELIGRFLFYESHQRMGL
jgi:anaerobic dimethyl sulfoxide reductase subunit C (anchor subunit)